MKTTMRELYHDLFLSHVKGVEKFSALVKKPYQSVDKVSSLRDNTSYVILSRPHPRHTSNRATRTPLHVVQGAYAEAARGRQPIHSLHLP